MCFRGAPRHQDGFSLIELMVVVVIIAVLTSIVIPVFSSAMDKAHRAATASVTRELYNGLTQYYADHGSFPTSVDPVTLAPLSKLGYVENTDHILSKLVNNEVGIYISVGPDEFWLVTQSKGDPQSYFVAAKTTLWYGGGTWSDGVFWYDWTISDIVPVSEAM